MTGQPEKLDLRSFDIIADKRQVLLRLFPEVHTEGGKIDFERLRIALGETVDVGKERYGMNWPGKADCFKTIQTPSLGTLLPCPGESVDFETTENLIIEGDNLEVLKLLQKSYLGKVKMIYIDPPYNTGNDFIYPDNYTESLQTYLEYTGQVDGNGKKFSTNTDTDGRFHSKWLNMMYPRLYLARNLLREDGVIFISIDDNETGNLRRICDDVFGEENYLVTLYIQVRYADKTLAEKNDYQKLIEQVHVYRKGYFTPRKESEDYTLEKFCWNIVEKMAGREFLIGGRQVIVFGDGEYEICRVSPSINGLKETWATGSVLKANASGKFFGNHLAPRKNEDGLGCLYKVYGIGEDGLGYRYFTGPKRAKATKGKFYSGVPLDRRQQLAQGAVKKLKPILNWYDFADAFGNCRHEGEMEFGSGKKPVAFLQKLLSMATDNKEPCLVLDFFAGSGSTAHAVLDLNRQDGGLRRFILVQLPEPTEREDLVTIADICKERVRRVIKKLNDEDAAREPGLFDENGPKQDRGFRVFKLAESNFKLWNADVPHDEKTLIQQLELHIDHIRQDRMQEDILYEILLKDGFPLTAPVETLQLAGKTVYSVAEGALFICLERELTLELIRAMAEKKPERVVCLDEGFAGNDQLKANAVHIFKTRGVTSFKTV